MWDTLAWPALTWDVIVPGMILVVILLFLVIVLARAQTRPDFDIVNFLRDENGKESALRAFTFIAVAITSWVIATLTFQGKLTPDYFLYYNLTWANTLALTKLVERWNGVLPLSKSSNSGSENVQPTSPPA